MFLNQIHHIKGLQYFQNFITPSERNHILSIIANHDWCNRLRRPQQYYGIKYFQTKIEDSILQPATSKHHPLSVFQSLIQKTIRSHIFEQSNPPNQVLINKYSKRDRLGLHVQDTAAFGQIIAGISIGSKDYLRLVETANSSNAFLLELQDCSCYVLSGDARYKFRHGIGRTIQNQKYKDDQFQRISLTLRHVIETRRKIESNPAVHLQSS